MRFSKAKNLQNEVNEVFCRLRCFLFYIMRYTELCYRMRCSPVLQNAVTTSGKHPDGCASRAVCRSFSVTYLYVECSVKDVPRNT